MGHAVTVRRYGVLLTAADGDVGRSGSASAAAPELQSCSERALFDEQSGSDGTVRPVEVDCEVSASSS